MKTGRRMIAMLAVAGVSAGIALGGPDDNTRRGLTRPASSPSAPPAGSAPANSQPSTSQPANPQPAPNRAPAREPQSAPPPRAVAPSGPSAPSAGPGSAPRVYVPGEGMRRGSAPSPSVRPPVVGTPQNPATVDQTRRALNRDPSPSKPRPVPVVSLPSGTDTARAIEQARNARPSTDNTKRGGLVKSIELPTTVGMSSPTAAALDAPRAPAGGGIRSRGGVSLPLAATTDNTRRDLVKPLNLGGGGGGGGGGNWDGSWNSGGWHGHGRGWRRHDSWHGSWAGNSWYGNTWGSPWYGTGVYYDPWTNWSTGIPSTTLDSFGGFGRDPWSYSSFNYAGPGWYPATDWSVRPYEFSYTPYLGQDVWQLETSPYTSGGFADSFGITDYRYSTGIPETVVNIPAPEPVIIPAIEAGALPRVNPGYDVRNDFASAVQSALGGEYSASVYAMRRAAMTNPGGLVGRESQAGRGIMGDAAWGQQVRAALRVYQNPPRRVVSETDAQFMVAALSAALGEDDEARYAVDAALIAGDAATSTRLLGRAVRGESLETVGPWVTGQRVR